MSRCSKLLPALPLLVALTALGADAPAANAQAGARPADITVLVVGDSISAGYGIQMEQGWVNLLRQRLGETGRVVNASISGDTTSGGLERLPRTLREHRPDLVVIELGGNDGLRGYPVRNIHDNLLAMTQAVIDSGATPILAGMQIPPNYGPRYTQAFHRIYANIAATTGAALIPFLLEGVATERDLMQDDGIHPTASAQQRLLDNAWDALAPLLPAADLRER